MPWLTESWLYLPPACPQRKKAAHSKSAGVRQQRLDAIIARGVPALLIGVLATAHDVEAHDTQGIVWPDSSKTATIGGSALSVRTSSRVAGAIDGLVWHGKQFVNSSDHGREIQAAAAFSASHRECFNPTEGGSASDGVGPTSTSYLTRLEVAPNRLTTEVRMAYWLSPQDKDCRFLDSPKDGPLSRDVLRKRITIGAFGLPNVIRFETTFILSEARRLGGFEAPTGYMAADFSEFWIYDRKSDRLEIVAGELKYQDKPIVFSTPDKLYAIGVYAPPQRVSAIYAGRRFTDAKMFSPTVKWVVFFRENEVAAGEHRFDTYIVVGSLDHVRATLKTLSDR